jgi:hypothetical protein
MAENTTPAQRHRRTNPKRKREEIYCYDEDINRNEEQIDSSDEDRDMPPSE